MSVSTRPDSNQVWYAENVRKHLARVEEIRQRLYDLDQKIESGDYTAETLNQFGAAYEEYLDVRAGKEFSERRSLLDRLFGRKM